MKELTERQKILLFFMAGSEEEITPIKVMKGMFIINERKCDLIPKEGRYIFYPFLFGPFTGDLYGDLGELERFGLVRSWNLGGMMWRFYQPTKRGIRVAEKLSKGYPRDLIEYTRVVRQWVNRTPLVDILRAIYREFPEYR